MILAVDTETTGTDFYHGCRAFMVTACDGKTNYWWQGEVNPYTREVFWDEDDLEDMWSVIDAATSLIFHNAKFDVLALKYVGLPIETKWPIIHDTIIAAHAVNAAHDTYEEKGSKRKLVGRSLGLKPLASEYFGFPIDDEEELQEAVIRARNNAPAEYRIAKKGDPCFPAQRNQKWHKMDYWMAPEECLRYGMGDVERTLLLWLALKPSLIEDNLWEIYKERMKLCKNCYDLTYEGEDFNKGAAKKYIAEVFNTKEAIRQEMKALFNINWALVPSKPAHIASILTTNIGIKSNQLQISDAGKVQTNKAAIAHYAQIHPHPFFDLLTKWKREDARERYITSYYEWCCDDGRIHGNFNPTGTRETRQSSDNPNQQNRTGALDKFFKPKSGWIWWDADFENIEMRIWAYAVNNPELVRMFNNNESYHMFVFNELFPSQAAQYALIKNKQKGEMTEAELRLAEIYRKIKEFNFGIIYGSTENAADEKIGPKGSYRKLVTKIPEIEEFNRRLTKEVHINLDKYGVPSIYTLGNYRLPVPISEPYKACNYYVQGSAGIITMDAMEAIKSDEDYIDSGSKMYAQVHDSIRVKIPICNETSYLVDHFTSLMVKAGEKYIPTCGVTYNIISPEGELWPF
jgi:DNA polymerase I-like protein with 3'-5' exonuclease and polymerase domains